MGQVKFGLSNIHYAKYDATAKTFATPKAWPGAVSLTAEPQGDTANFYADNIAYYTSISSSSISGTLTIADVPDDVRVDLLGDVKDEKTGMLLEDLGALPSQFALMGEVDGDPKKRRFVYYNCKLSRPSSEHNTKEDSVTPDTDALNFTANALEMAVNGETRQIAKATVETDGAAYANWFKQVTMPGATAAGGTETGK